MLRLRTKTQQLEMRVHELTLEKTILKLQGKQCIGREPEVEEFDQLTPQLQKWWAKKYPSLERYRKSPTKRTYTCNYIFKDGTICEREFKQQREAKECRKFHLSNERLSESATPTPTPQPPKTNGPLESVPE